MLIAQASSNKEGIAKVIFYSETKKEDYVLNHMLCMVCDTHDSEDAIMARKYQSIGDNVVASDRKCIVKTVNISRGKNE